MKKLLTTIVSLKFFGSLVFTQLAEFTHNLNRRISKIKKLITTIISLMFFGNLVFAQLTEFSMGDILSAGAMNQNFKYLENRFGGIRETTVNCGTSGSGSGINSAIQNGYNSIVINGICKENIKLDGREGNTPRLLKLRGANNDYTKDKIIDNSSYTDHVVNVLFNGIVVTIDNLTLSGGIRTVRSWGPNIFRMENVKVDDYKQRGIHMTEGSVIDGHNIIIDGTNSSADSNERGIWLGLQSYGWFENLQILNNTWCGLCVWENSQTHLVETNSFSGNGIGIYVSLSSLRNSSNITINNSADYGIKAYHGKIWNYGTMTISDNSDGDYAVMIDSSEAYLKNMTITGGTGTNNLVEVWQGQLTLDGATIKDHQGLLFYAGGGSTLHFEGTNSFSNKDSSSSRCVVAFDDTDFKFDGSTTINGTNSTGCTAFGFKRSRGQIKNITVTGPEEALYAQTSDVEIRGGTFSSTGKKAVTVLEGSRFKIYSNDNDISITSSADDALDVKSSYLHLKKGSSKNLTISSTASGESAINIRERSTVDITGNTNTYANVEVKLGSYLHIDENVTITTLGCTNSSKIHKEGTVTNTSACDSKNYISD